LESIAIFLAIWNILRTFGIFYDHLVHFVFIWHIFQVLVSCTKKNLATLHATISAGQRIVRKEELAARLPDGLFSNQKP
jgi:hypothetical protein